MEHHHVVIVRPARQEDVAAIVEIVERCNIGAEDVNYGEWTGIILVAVRQSQVVGFISALPAKPYAVVTEMAVLPEYQKGRACHKLIESMELLLRHLGCTAWAGYVREKNTAMRDVLDNLEAYRSDEVGYMYHRSL